MTFGGVWQMFTTTFSVSPYLGSVVVLILWLSFCWKFRLVAIGRKRSLPDTILETFSLQSENRNRLTLNSLSKEVAVPGPTEGENTNKNSKTHEWKVGEIYQIYWTLVAKGQVVRYTTVIIAFSALCLLIMHLAQPRESVSLLNVANIIGAFTFLPLLILLLLSLAKVLCSIHQLPCDGIKEHKPQTVIFFSW